MKALPLLLACISLAGCDVKKALTVEGAESGEGTSESAKPGSATNAKTTPKTATPKPTPKQGDWMFDKKHRTLLDPPSHK